MSRTNSTGIAVLLLIFLFMYTANVLIPLCYGDDYLYSFVWEEGQRLYEPLSESARRIDSWKDYFDSLWAHYFSHSGRIINFIPIFFFLWQGNGYFDFFNSIIAVLLVMEIYWISNRGKVDFDFDPVKLCWIFFVMWTFHNVFVSVFLWVTGACNYLWPAVLWIGFLIPYVRHWYENDEKKFETDSLKTGICMFLFGIVSGWTNENTGCCIILLLLLLLFEERRNGQRVMKWETAGILGFILGYVFLIGAPGNYVRLSEDMAQGLYNADYLQNLYRNGTVWLVGVIFQLPMWIVLWRILKKAEHHSGRTDVKKEILCIHAFFAVSFFTNMVMMLSPEFPYRSIFPSLLFLMISVFSAVRLSNDHGWNSWTGVWKRGCSLAAIIYFMITGTLSVYQWRCVYEYDRQVLSIVKKEAASPSMEVLEIERFPFRFWIYPASGLHAVKFELPEDPGNWKNAAYARYYGISGICVKAEN